jgi:hypothetical protein
MIAHSHANPRRVADPRAFGRVIDQRWATIVVPPAEPETRDSHLFSVRKHGTSED